MGILSGGRGWLYIGWFFSGCSLTNGVTDHVHVP